MSFGWSVVCDLWSIQHCAHVLKDTPHVPRSYNCLHAVCWDPPAQSHPLCGVKCLGMLRCCSWPIKPLPRPRCVERAKTCSLWALCSFQGRALCCAAAVVCPDIHTTCTVHDFDATEPLCQDTWVLPAASNIVSGTAHLNKQINLFCFQATFCERQCTVVHQQKRVTFDTQKRNVPSGYRRPNLKTLRQRTGTRQGRQVPPQPCLPRHRCWRAGPPMKC